MKDGCAIAGIQIEHRIGAEAQVHGTNSVGRPGGGRELHPILIALAREVVMLALAEGDRLRLRRARIALEGIGAGLTNGNIGDKIVARVGVEGYAHRINLHRQSCCHFTGGCHHPLSGERGGASGGHVRDGGDQCGRRSRCQRRIHPEVDAVLHIPRPGRRIVLRQIGHRLINPGGKPLIDDRRLNLDGPIVTLEGSHRLDG